MLAFLNLERLLPAFAHRGPRARLRDFAALRRQRLHLARLDSRLLQDVGLTSDEATEEARRALWDVPRHWRA